MAPERGLRQVQEPLCEWWNRERVESFEPSETECLQIKWTETIPSPLGCGIFWGIPHGNSVTNKQFWNKDIKSLKSQCVGFFFFFNFWWMFSGEFVAVCIKGESKK